tara:strand:- start:343 stop:1197 length:855 start_codon:yes stop_codon:yes gene_type:complete
MIRFNTTVGKLEFYNGTLWSLIGGVSGTGGTITSVGGYTIHTFTTSGTFTVNSGGEVEYLIVGGGGAGATTDGGGGGAGGVLMGTLNVNIGSYTITRGSGGAYVNANDRAGNNGTNTTALGFTAIGGGGGGNDRVSGQGPKSGGSGGGGGSRQSQGQWEGASGTAGPPRQGYDGGDGVTSPALISGGGGGAGETGKDGNDGSRPAGGGDGIQWPSGSGTYYGGGGGGGHNVVGQGGQGGGGNGSNGNLTTAGAANTGGGGGGGGNGHTRGSNGGSGIVIIRYLQ